MATPERRYKISEVAKELDVKIHVLRQWEERFPQLKPKRDRVQRRYYLQSDIEIARRIKQLTQNDHFKSKGARIRLSQELHIEGRPKTRKELLDLLDTIEDDVRKLLDTMEENDRKWAKE